MGLYIALYKPIGNLDFLTVVFRPFTSNAVINTKEF